MKIDNMLICKINLTTPNGKEFTYDIESGLMTYDGIAGGSFSELLANNTLTDEDRSIINALDEECDRD